MEENQRFSLAREYDRATLKVVDDYRCIVSMDGVVMMLKRCIEAECQMPEDIQLVMDAIARYLALKNRQTKSAVINAARKGDFDFEEISPEDAYPMGPGYEVQQAYASQRVITPVNTDASAPMAQPDPDADNLSIMVARDQIMVCFYREPKARMVAQDAGGPFGALSFRRRVPLESRLLFLRPIAFHPGQGY